MIDALLEEAQAWHASTFHTATGPDVGRKIVEEACELALALGTPPDEIRQRFADTLAREHKSGALEEIADVLVVVGGILRFVDGGLGALRRMLALKMRINRARALHGRWSDARRGDDG